MGGVNFVAAQIPLQSRPAWLLWTLQAVYFYILAATFILIWTNLARRASRM